MSGANWLKVRRLAASEDYVAVAQGWTENILEIVFSEDRPAMAAAPGALVEVESAERVHLGVVLAAQAGRASILVEHTLERGEIESIRSVWSPPE